MNKKLSYKLLLLTIIFSTLITLGITILQLYIDYRHGMKSIDEQFELVVDSYSPSLSQGVWVYDEDQINLQLKGIVSLPDILFGSIDLLNGNHYEYGKETKTKVVHKTFELLYNDGKKEIKLGQLNIIADLNSLYSELTNKIFILLVSQGLKTFFVSFFILFLFQLLITRHIQEILLYTTTLTFNKKNKPLVLNKVLFKNHYDELDSLADAINTMQTKIYNDYIETKKREHILQEQSRLAQMGEMISMIAHQWRQPLSALALVFQKQQFFFDKGQLDSSKIHSSTSKGISLIDQMSTTIDDFRNFYKANKTSKIVHLDNVISKSLNIVEASLVNANVKIIKEYNSIDEIELYDSELMQVILNILKNAQDNFKEKEIKNPFIKITTEKRSISICDNGGGIPEEIIDSIFDPYFSTKDEKNGTGLGLYLSKTIIEDHHKGTLSVKNIKDGVCFTIELGSIQEIESFEPGTLKN